MTSMEHYCKDCEEPCAGEWEDQGVGSYEFWGQVGNDVNWVWVSECCGATVIDEDGVEVDPPGDRY